MKTIRLLTAGLSLACLIPCTAIASDDSTSSPPSLQQVETLALEYLSAGQQAKAEALLNTHTAHYPDLLQIIDPKTFLPSKAKERIADLKKRHGNKQRLFFLLAACQRSRFDIAGAFPAFYLVYKLDPKTTAGKCSLHILNLDSRKNRQPDATTIDHEFAALAELADANPDDTVVRWMAAVQCRSWNRNREGVQHYGKILQQWNPGPVLVHQTYANLLDQLGQFDEALVERRKAVEMEPAGWSYDGMANTLHNMRRFSEANEAHIQAVRLNPNSSSHWCNWACTLFDEGNYSESIAMSKRSTDLDPQNGRAWRIWGKALMMQGHPFDALEKYKQAAAVHR